MIGDIIGSTVRRPPVAVTNTMGPRIASALALKAYLEAAVFVVDGGEANDRSFSLTTVREDWPTPNDDLDYPTASIVETAASVYDAHNLVPTALEDTLGVYDCLVGNPEGVPAKTVLWKEGELVTAFQVDFWTASKPEREAIEGALSAKFSPSEERTGVLLEGPEAYYSLPIRFTLMSTRNDDSAATAYPNEWRLRCSIQTESDIVSLRQVTLLTPQSAVDVVDPKDPED